MFYVLYYTAVYILFFEFVLLKTFAFFSLCAGLNCFLVFRCKSFIISYIWTERQSAQRSAECVAASGWLLQQRYRPTEVNEPGAKPHNLRCITRRPSVIVTPRSSSSSSSDDNDVNFTLSDAVADDHDCHFSACKLRFPARQVFFLFSQLLVLPGAPCCLAAGRVK